MIYFIDGLQNVGKSTLLSSLKHKKHFVFPFGVIDKKLHFNKQELNGFQIGKDLGMLFLLQNLNLKKDIVFDRGPLSSVFYSIIDHRLPDDRLEKFVQLISQYNKNCCFIFVRNINDNREDKNRNRQDDNFNNLEYRLSKENIQKALDKIKSLFLSYNIQWEIFENDFSKDVKENKKEFLKLLKRMKHEHGRDHI